MDGKFIELLTDINNKLDKLITEQKDPNELLTIEQVCKEKGIGESTVRSMFKDPNSRAITSTVPFKITRRNLNRYLDKYAYELGKEG